MNVTSNFKYGKILPVIVGIAFAIGVVAAGYFLLKPPPMADKVILISVDTLRPDFLGCYDSSIQTTPAIDSLANEGVVFEGALCNYPKTTPSHTSMLSGLYPWSHGVRENNQKIPDEVVLLPEILQSRGWKTGGFVSLTTVKGIYGFDRGFDVYDDKLVIRGPAATGGHERRCMDTMEPALEWLGRHKEDKVFMFLHLGDPHGPYLAPIKYRRDLTPPDKTKTLPLGRDNYAVNAIPKYQVIKDHTEIDFYVQRYQAEINYLDDCMKLFLDKLKEMEIYDRTMIVFTSDHGEAMGEHQQWFQHGSSLFYEQVRVPLVITYPGSKAGRVSGIAESVDLLPTILEYLKIEVPPEIEGKSLLACLVDPSQPAKSTWYGDLNYIEGIERDSMKLLLHKQSKSQVLFDITADPHELIDQSKKYQEVRDIMVRELNSFIKSRRGLKAKRPHMTDQQRSDEIKALKTLGYLE